MGVLCLVTMEPVGPKSTTARGQHPPKSTRDWPHSVVPWGTSLMLRLGPDAPPQPSLPHPVSIAKPPLCTPTPQLSLSYVCGHVCSHSPRCEPLRGWRQVIFILMSVSASVPWSPGRSRHVCPASILQVPIDLLFTMPIPLINESCPPTQILMSKP